MSSDFEVLVDRHRVWSISHHEESIVVVVFDIGGVVCELSACRSRPASSFSALLFAMADLSAIVAYGLPTFYDVEAPPSSEGSSMASVFLPKF